MKISYRTAGTGTYTTLAEDAARTFISAFRVVPSQVIQVTGPFRSANARVFGRGNRQFAIRFTVSKEHATIAAAVDYLVTHPAALPNTADLKIEEGATTSYAVRAALVRCEPIEEVNKSTLYLYEFIAEKYQGTAP